jgi:UDP-N-acetylmuramoyl-tripeptide--D-alanyl-D-alanine ligase
MNLGRITEAVKGKLANAAPGRKVSGVSIDSRRIRPQELFVALAGEHADGHQYLKAAITAGAAAGLCRRVPRGLPAIKVDNPRKALGDLAAVYRQRFPKITVAAVTGSSGKTATKEMLAHILASQGQVLESQGNFNNDIGLPLTLVRMNSRQRQAVLEMGMNAPGEIRRLARIAGPQVGIITNIGDAHLGCFKNRRALAQAKAELLPGLLPEGAAILNADDPFLARLASRYPGLTFGMAPGADIKVVAVRVSDRGTRVRLKFRGRTETLGLKCLGGHQAWNAAAAVGGAMAMGMDFVPACRALEGYYFRTSMRLEILRRGGLRIINDAYNSSPQSAAAALKLLGQLPTRGEKIFIAGSMLELGKFTQRAHRELGRQTVLAGVSKLITVGEAARGIAEGARRAGMKWIRRLDSAEEAATLYLSRISSPSARDLVLVKGSRAIGLERFVAAIKKRAGAE